MPSQAEMPRYRCHKEVHGLKIEDIEIHHDGSYTIHPEEPYQAFVTDRDWGSRFKGSLDDLGYYVLYKGGYASWSPTKEFEEGYTLIN